MPRIFTKGKITNYNLSSTALKSFPQGRFHTHDTKKKKKQQNLFASIA